MMCPKNRVSLVVGCLFLTLAAGIAVTGERIVDRDGDRTKAAKGRHATFEAPRFSPELIHMPTAFRSFGSRMASTDKATTLLALAAKQEHSQALATLQRIVMMDLPSNERADAVRSRAYEKIARFYTDAPSKQVAHLGLALQFAATADRRAELWRRILNLGGDPFVTAFRAGPDTTFTSRDPGTDDSCLGAISVVLPHTETMSITPAGDHNWRSFDLAGPGAFVRIQTISDMPGYGSDDTDLTLWGDCPENGGSILAFNDDTATDFTSRIDTHCLAPGTYYVEVGGFFDLSTPDNFDLEIEVTASCEAPSVDSFEPDDDRADASDIGLPTPTSGLGWGRARHEIQARNIFPPGDTDHAKFGLTQNSLVRMGTKAQWPTFFNGFAGSGPFDNPDTRLSLFYESRPSLGGRCNQPDLGFLPICYSDDDCPDPLDNPLPGFPPCIQISFCPGPQLCDDSLLARNDDRSVGDLGSELLMCLPSSAANSPSLTLQRWGGDYLVEIKSFSSSDIFSYELQVKNEVGCLFEQEPNNAFEDATPIEVGQSIAAFYDFVATNPVADADLYRFDVDETTTLRFETFAPDSLQSDTALELYVGPDDNGEFFFTGISDDDGGAGFLSALTLTLQPASELLGNTTADADYFLNVTSFFFNRNYYYELDSEIIASPDVIETEPNDTEATANPVSIGDTIAGAIDVICDYDIYTFTLGADTFVTVESTAGGDSAIQLTDCNGDVLSCDDDSGPGLLPLLDGCLPAGTYCMQVRAFSAGNTFTYELELHGTAGCMATDPPAMSGDNAFTCLDFDTCP